MALILNSQSVVDRRQARGLTQEALAQELQVDRSTVHRWESGATTPRGRILTYLAEELGCEVADITVESSKDAQPAGLDGFLLDDGSYSRDKFYTKNLDPQNHLTERFQFRISEALAAEIDKLYRSKEVPEIGNPGELGRDSLYHRLKDIAEMRKMGKLLKIVTAEMHEAELAALIIQQEKRQKNVDKARAGAEAARNNRDIGMARDLIEMLERQETEVPPPYNGDLRAIREDMERWVKEMRG